jgi:hypothetical protein
LAADELTAFDLDDGGELKAPSNQNSSMEEPATRAMYCDMERWAAQVRPTSCR